MKGIGQRAETVNEYVLRGLRILFMDEDLQILRLADGKEIQARQVDGRILNGLKSSEENFKVGQDYLVYKRDKKYGPVTLDETVYGKKKTGSKKVQVAKEAAEKIKKSKQ